jgi:hypothetical protein
MSAKAPSTPFGRPAARKAVRLTADTLVTVDAPSAASLPAVIRPAVPQVSLVEWARANRGNLEGHLLEHGALLFRGFGVTTVEGFESFAAATCDEGLLDYTYGSTPRRRISGGIYTSTEYPADQTIPMHNEMSYGRSWPLRLWFCCLKPAAVGGATPLADSAAVFDAIPPAIRERFIERGVLYVRNYGSGPDLSCEQVFGTSDPVAIEGFCREARIECAFGLGGKLRTRQVCQAIAVHPKTGRTLWFNQAHLFHVSSVGPAGAAALLAEFGEPGLPRNAYYGDGAPIEAEVLAELREA